MIGGLRLNSHCTSSGNDLLIHSRSWAFLQKTPIVQPLKNFPAFYGTWRFNAVFTRALHSSLYWATSIQSTSFHSISLIFIQIFFTHPRLGLPSGLFPSGFPTNILYAFLSSLIRNIYILPALKLKNLYIFPAECIYAFHTILRISCDYFSEHH
jgi:hypothetical protein